MNLGNIFQPRNRNVKQVNVPATGTPTGSVSAGERNYRVMSEMKNLSPGQTLQGEVVAKNGNTVQIALDEETVLTARLERDLNIALGQSMSFEVKANSSSLLSLMPLYSNMANEATIMKALAAAGLPQTSDNMKMIADMMKEGMPIDKDTIAYVSRQLADFPNASPESVIQMIRLGLPITEINIEQFEMYKNYEHQIIQSAAQIMKDLPQVFSELLAQGKDAEGFAFYEQIIKALTGEETAEGIKDALITNDEVSGDTSGANPSLLNPAGENDGAGAPEQGMPKESAVGTMQEQPAQNMGELTGQDATALKTEEGLPEKSPLSPKAWQALGNMLQRLGVDEETAEQIGKGNVSPKAALSQISALLRGNAHMFREDFQESMKSLLGSKTFQNLLQSQMTSQWLLKPDEVAQKENVERLYERIREQTAKMNEAFQMVGKADTAGAKSVQNLQNNVDFMNQMNHLFTYVQLPLKMAGNQAHGDLYVYTNKKSLANKDGNVSALLHLDMENLGPLDVYVTMQKTQNKVSTNFTVKDEMALDLIAKHIHILNERLEKRGYSMHANFQLKEDVAQTNVMQEILLQNKNISALSRTSFDMRA